MISHNSLENVTIMKSVGIRFQVHNVCKYQVLGTWSLKVSGFRYMKCAGITFQVREVCRYQVLGTWKLPVSGFRYMKSAGIRFQVHEVCRYHKHLDWRFRERVQISCWYSYYITFIINTLSKIIHILRTSQPYFV